MQTQIQSVVFDIGNVLVRWSPLEIIRLTFGENDDNPIMARAVFQSEIWLALNQGDITWDEAKQAYQNQFGFSDIHSAALFDYIKRTQILIHGSQALLREVKDAGYSVYALTDNVLDIVDYLKQTYDFWPLFDGEIISANEGCLKPNATIYQALTQRYQLD
ncbi:MAG: HAD family hydrolase, partial [Vibrio sp.]